MALVHRRDDLLFTVVRAVLLQPLPFRDPDNLVMVYEHFRSNTVGIRITRSLPATSTSGAADAWL